VRGSAVQLASPVVTCGVTVASPLLLLTVKNSCVLVVLPGVMHRLVIPGACTSTTGCVLIVTMVTFLSTSRQALWSC
jgi:hypothetical protein